MAILDDVRIKRIFFDGAMGTMLMGLGLKAGSVPETLNIDDPALIESIHAAYIDEGCDIITANTFGANRIKLDGDIPAIIRAGLGCVRRAIGRTGGKKRYAALDIGPTGHLLKPIGDITFNEAYEAFAEAVRAGVEAGADLILIETMSDLYELKAAVLAAKESSSLPVFATVTLDKNGKLLTGADIPAVVATLEGLRVDLLGVNCSLGPTQLLPFVEEICKYASIPVMAQPNAGMPELIDGREIYSFTPSEFAEGAAALALKGVSVLGGCCGTTPEHIRKMIEITEKIPLPDITCKEPTIICSFCNTVVLDRPRVIGERINPTGKKSFREAIKSGDTDYILREAIAQADNGADILDVNVGLPEIDEAALMEDIVPRIQAVVALPLQIDSADPKALEKALRVYNGKALINSVNGKRESMEAVFPLVKRYGGVVAGLTLDEKGIPDTAEGRLAIARRIVETAAGYGIQKKDIIIDTLTLAASAGAREAGVTLEALALITRELGVKTILGVSNISFGLPDRDTLNASFLTMALQNGLTCAIINPNSSKMMSAFRAFCALSGYDTDFKDYIRAQSDIKPPILQEVRDESLGFIIRNGLTTMAGSAANRLLETMAPLDIINSEIIPVLDLIGKEYESGVIFLPQLLRSAEATNEAFTAIRSHMERENIQGENRGRIIVATVKGDIHDIGKNIVKALLKNYGFDVIDLGRDVPPEKIVETAVRENIRLIGLSALMTTTLPSMRDTIALLRAANHECHVFVGGAVLTPEYADMIGADKYAKDALASVEYARETFG